MGTEKKKLKKKLITSSVFVQPLWNREFIWSSYISHDKDGNWFISSQSIQSHPKAPLRESEVVRGIVIGDIGFAEPLDGGKRSRVTVVNCTDPMGYIPSAVINFVAKQNGNAIGVARSVFLAKK